MLFALTGEIIGYEMKVSKLDDELSSVGTEMKNVVVGSSYRD